MHEVSVCQGIIEAVEMEMQPAELENIREVHISVGVLAGIEPSFLKQVYGLMVSESCLKNSVLHCTAIDTEAFCSQCRKPFPVQKNVFVCPDCELPSAEVIKGKELLIEKIILENPIYEKADEQGNRYATGT